MDWFGLFTRLDGRIGRRSFWAGLVVLALAFFLADLLTRRVGVALFLFIPFIYLLIAVLVKRLHDRGRSGWWAAVLLAPLGAALAVALGARIIGLGETAITTATSVAIWISMLALGGLIVFELGLRPGDPGYSEHGPPPLS